MAAQSRAYTSVVLPNKPPIDKVAALVIVQTHSRTPIESASVWTTNECPEAQFAAWADQGVYAIDIGKRKYHSTGFGSATALAADEFGIEMTPGWRRLIKLINDNNTDGSLRNFPFAIARMMREMYEVDDSEEHQMTIISAVSNAVSAFVDVENGHKVREPEVLDAALPHLVKEFAACNYEPFTLGRYLRDMFVLGVDLQEIDTKLHFFVYGGQEVGERLEAARAEFKALERKDTFGAKGYRGIILKTDDRFLSAAAKRAGFDMRIIVGSKGHTVIATDGADLSQVADKLLELEPQCWYFPPGKTQSKMTALINGGPQYTGVPPTQLPTAKIMGLVQQYVVEKSKKK